MATTERTEDVGRRVSDGIMKAYHENAPEVIDELFTDDFVCHLPGGAEVRGPEGYKERIAATLAAFPDFQKTEEMLVVDGDEGAVLYRWTGTHEGEFMGIEPTGKRVETTSAALLRFEGDRLAEMWAYSDADTLKEQLGVES